jgi:hypothetical protein
VCCLDVEQLTRLCDVVGASGVGEEAVVADAMETAGQDVDQAAMKVSFPESGIGRRSPRSA